MFPHCWSENYIKFEVKMTKYLKSKNVDCDEEVIWTIRHFQPSNLIQYEAR